MIQDLVNDPPSVVGAANSVFFGVREQATFGVTDKLLVAATQKFGCYHVKLSKKTGATGHPGVSESDGVNR
ncbi:hypothetical protein ILP92_16285 [Maribius pontilimi]|uniref:Uncharacterized protein n=1 Tax=Palleronia pontilimi TaxID=1964209 RepID=A0A934IJU9_9RHOB|nr:hypothetical protein [Palleronia pontilimi]MBJ3764307.1 hypothetical protein [Palleronia pontilimi]